MSFHDSMYEEGYSDEEEYLEHLFDDYDRYQEELKQYDLSSQSSYYEDEECHEEEYWNYDDEKIKHYIKEWCKNNPRDKEFYFILYHFSNSNPDYKRLITILTETGSRMYSQFEAWTDTEFLGGGSSRKWIENNKLELFFSGFLFQKIDDFNWLYDEEYTMQERISLWESWGELKHNFYNWLKSSDLDERNNFFNEVKSEIHNQKGILSAMMEYYVEVKEKLFEEECSYLIDYIFTNIKKAYKVFYKVRCYKKYDQKNSNAPDLTALLI